MVPIRRAARAGTAVSTAAKKHSLKIESTKTEAGDRVYRSRSRDSGSESGLRPLPARVAAFLRPRRSPFHLFIGSWVEGRPSGMRGDIW
jgi:hypothetical protein